MKTRILIKIWGDNFESIESNGEWFETNPLISFTWDSQSYGSTLVVYVHIRNQGEVTAKNVQVWAGFDAGNNQVYSQDISNIFDLSGYETQSITLQLKIPRNVYTRVVVRIWGNNFELMENASKSFRF